MVSRTRTISRCSQPWKIVDGSFIECTSGFIVPQELIGILCNGPSVDTGGIEEDEDLATEADTMINIAYEDASDEYD